MPYGTQSLGDKVVHTKDGERSRLVNIIHQGLLKADVPLRTATTYYRKLIQDTGNPYHDSLVHLGALLTDANAKLVEAIDSVSYYNGEPAKLKAINRAIARAHYAVKDALTFANRRYSEQRGSAQAVGMLQRSAMELFRVMTGNLMRLLQYERSDLGVQQRHPGVLSAQQFKSTQPNAALGANPAERTKSQRTQLMTPTTKQYLPIAAIRKLSPRLADAMAAKGLKRMSVANLPPDVKTALKAAAVKQDTGKLPLGTLKLLVQAMPKELRAMHLATVKLNAAVQILSQIDHPDAQAATRSLVNLREQTSKRYRMIDTEWRDMAQELKLRGERANTITPLSGRAKAASTKLDIGPFRIRINSKGDIEKAKAKLAELQQAIQKLQPLVNSGKQMLTGIQNAIDYMQGAFDYMDNAEQTIPGTQLEGLVPHFGAAMRRVVQTYKVVEAQIQAAKADLGKMQQEAGKLKATIQQAGG